MTKPTNEEIAALERWHSALADAERALSQARPACVRYDVLDLATAIPGCDPSGDSLIRNICAMRRQIDHLLQSIQEEATP